MIKVHPFELVNGGRVLACRDIDALADWLGDRPCMLGAQPPDFRRSTRTG